MQRHFLTELGVGVRPSKTNYRLIERKPAGPHFAPNAKTVLTLDHVNRDWAHLRLRCNRRVLNRFILRPNGLETIADSKYEPALITHQFNCRFRLGKGDNVAALVISVSLATNRGADRSSRNAYLVS